MTRKLQPVDTPQPPEPVGDDLPAGPGGDRTPTDSFRLRCPTCEYTEQARSRALLALRQRNTPCPNCNRMLGLARCRP